jgi:hypothetical protein
MRLTLPALPPEVTTADKIRAFERERDEIKRLPERERRCERGRLAEIDRQLKGLLGQLPGNSG